MRWLRCFCFVNHACSWRSRVIWHHPIQTEAAKPAVGQIEVNLIAQAPLRADPEAVTYQEHTDQQLRINRRWTDAAVEWRQFLPDCPRSINLSTDRSRWSAGICLSSENS